MERYGSARGGSSARTILITATIAFIVGAALVGYLMVRADSADETAIEAPETSTEEVAPTLPTPEESAALLAENEDADVEPDVRQVVEQTGGLDQRLAAAEQRIARLDLQAQAAAGNASRAESLLIAFAARRTLERGDELGYLADQLRLRYADARPRAVNAVLAAAEDPVTVDELIARLEGLAPTLQDAPDEATLDRLRRELSELFVVRRESTPSPQPARRLERARFFLQSGRLSLAIEEVSKLPGAEQEEAQAWMSDARRLSRAFEALDLLEGAAILDSGTVRSGEGEPIEQPSPVRQTAEQ